MEIYTLGRRSLWGVSWLSPRSLRVWTWVLRRSRLGVGRGLDRRYQITTHTWPEAALDRASAPQKASLEAHQQGVDVSGWRESIELGRESVGRSMP